MSASLRGLPGSVAPFIGRALEQRTVEALLEQERLITLLGPGGCGKTRLALEVARTCARGESFWFVDLARVTSGSAVGDAARDALRAPELAGESPAEAVVTFLAERRGIVLFDNCEHVIASAAALSEQLLDRCPYVRVLATSRAPLAIVGELIYRVPSLEEDDGVALFIDRARRVRGGMSSSEDMEAVIREIVGRLDGLPLAIELAAARTSVRGLREILGGLDERFALLHSQQRTSERHRSLRASVEWSYELLSKSHRRALRQLSVFIGGFTLAAAAAVTGDSDVEWTIAALVDNSLVVADDAHDGTRRYGMLETIRQFASDRLEETGDANSARDAHLDWVAALARAAEPHLCGTLQHVWLDRVEDEHANVREALRWAELRSRHDIALAIAGNLCFFWKLHSHFEEGRLHLERGLTLVPESSPDYADALWAFADISAWAGHTEVAYAAVTKALEISRVVKNQRVEARSLWTRGNLEATFDPIACRVSSNEAIALADQTSDAWLRGVARQLHALSYSTQDQYDAARPFLDEAIAIASEHEIRQLDGWNAILLMQAALAHGELQDAQDHLDAGIRASDALNDPSTRIFLIAGHADLLRLQGRTAEATRLLDAARIDLRLRAAGQVLPFLDAARARNAVGDDLAGFAAIDDLRAHVARLTVSWGFLADAELTAHYLAIGDCAAAAIAATDVIAIARAVDWYGAIADQLRYLGFARLVDDNHAAAAALHEALTLATHHNLRPRVASSLDAIGVLCSVRLNDIAAARLFGAAEALRREMGIVRVPPDDRLVAQAEAATAGRLGQDAFDAAFDEGVRSSFDSIIAYATKARGSRGRPEQGWASLTPAEQRVVELAAEGLTNREIGEQLFVTAGTVKTHLAQVFRKLDIRNRAALAAALHQRSMGERAVLPRD